MSSEINEKSPAGLAVTRDRRANAGARMSKLLQAEDEDEFYQTTYGGFAEEEDDNDYRSEDSASEATDSDIDIDENDEVKSDGEEEGVKRTKRLVTKAYQEPKATSSDAKPPVPRSKALSDPRPKMVELIDTSSEKKALRASTAEKSRSTEDTTKEREAKAAMIRAIADRKKVASVRRLTQEELLAEAMVTEQINLRSLEMYQRLELEKKRSKVHRPVQRGPMIRYRSVTVSLDPSPGDPAVKKEENETVTEAADDSKQSLVTATSPSKCSRNFVTFTDEALFRQYFPYAPPTRGKTLLNPPPSLPTPAKKQFCVVTGLPAKYFDPVTESPYATVGAFKILREEHDQRTAAVLAAERREGGGEALDVSKRKSRTSGANLMTME